MMLQQAAPLHVDVRAPGDTMTVFHPPHGLSSVELVIRWFFSVPQWVQLTGAALALIIAVGAVFIIWQRRHAVAAWLKRRDAATTAGWKVVGAAFAAAVLIVMGVSGTTFFVYSQNNNAFCVSCHTLHDEVYERFEQDQHHRIARLRCHDCHDEPLTAEVRQIGRWMLLRPAHVGPHAPVPRQVCATCHITKNPDSTWQHIIATAGHSVHLRSDSARKLGIDCITCHGVTAHRFVPVSETCAQSGCHTNVSIHLGKMAGQSMLHCVACHAFTAPVPETRQLELARKALVPSTSTCLGCHAMKRQLSQFLPENDPHKGRCGDCHNPHTQSTPRAAFQTCTNAGCHARPDTLTPLHRGVHAPVLASCGRCHQAHTWKVNGNSCGDCHRNLLKETGGPIAMGDRASPRTRHERAAPSIPAFVRFAGLERRRVVAPGSIPLPLPNERPAAIAPRPAAAATLDSVKFSHATHRALACRSCHAATGAIAIHAPGDCLTCHHQREVVALGNNNAACERCHTPAQRTGTLAQSVQAVTTTAPGGVPETLPFSHQRHATLACTDCHVSLATQPTRLTCSTCHAQHHVATSDCSACHTGALSAHLGRQPHEGCDGAGCHRDPAVLALSPSRNVCLACHHDMTKHQPGGDCANCHQVHWTSVAK